LNRLNKKYRKSRGKIAKEPPGYSLLLQSLKKDEKDFWASFTYLNGRHVREWLVRVGGDLRKESGEKTENGFKKVEKESRQQ